MTEISEHRSARDSAAAAQQQLAPTVHSPIQESATTLHMPNVWDELKKLRETVEAHEKRIAALEFLRKVEKASEEITFPKVEPVHEVTKQEHPHLATIRGMINARNYRLADLANAIEMDKNELKALIASPESRLKLEGPWVKLAA